MAVMAIRRSKKATAAPPQPDPPAPPPPVPAQVSVAVRFGIEAKSTGPNYYVNFAEVNVTPFEMVVTFARLPARFDGVEGERLAKGETLILPAEVQIAIPMNFVEPLVNAMLGQKAGYDKVFSPQIPPLGGSKPDE